jgi:hypothetical protein
MSVALPPPCTNVAAAYNFANQRLPMVFTMYEPEVLVPVTCPRCGQESLMRLAVSVVAEALIAAKRLQLSTACHSVEWSATQVELEQIREYLIASCIDLHGTSRANIPRDIHRSL